jgi:hypothetical protein
MDLLVPYEKKPYYLMNVQMTGDLWFCVYLRCRKDEI